MPGEEKGMKIISEMLKNGNDHIAGKSNKNVMLMPTEEFQSCNDSFIAFKEFTKIVEKAAVQENVHKLEIIEIQMTLLHLI